MTWAGPTLSWCLSWQLETAKIDLSIVAKWKLFYIIFKKIILWNSPSSKQNPPKKWSNFLLDGKW